MQDSDSFNWDKFSPEYVEKWKELKRNGERQIELLQKASLERIGEVIEVMESGYFPLHELIDVLATARPVKKLKALPTPPKTSLLNELEAERLDAYRVGLRNAKNEIREGRLVVRLFSTFFPVNSDPRISAWCSDDESQSLSIKEMHPPIDLVVSFSDARAWLERLSVPVPAWLNRPRAPEMDRAPTVPSDSMHTVHSTIYDRLLAAIAAFPTAFPAYSTSPPKLNNVVRPWLMSESFAANEKEAHVFGAVIRDHFKLSGDTPDAMTSNAAKP